MCVPNTRKSNRLCIIDTLVLHDTNISEVGYQLSHSYQLWAAVVPLQLETGPVSNLLSRGLLSV
jgi:hypothetical protein